MKVVARGYWAPAAALLHAGWVQFPSSRALGAALGAIGVVFLTTWLTELIDPSVATREDVPCTTLLPAGSVRVTSSPLPGSPTGLIPRPRS